MKRGRNKRNRASRAGIQQNANPVSIDRQSENHQENGHDNRSETASEIQQPQPNSSEHESGHTKQVTADSLIARWTKILGWSTVCLFLATFGSGIVLFLTELTLRDTLIETRKAANAAKDSVENTKSIMRIDQRAWIGLDYIDAVPNNPEVGKTFGAKGAIKNTGKTPARNLVIYSIIEPVDTGKRPNFSYEGIPKIIGGFLPPNGRAFLPLNVLVDLTLRERPPAIFTQEQMDLFRGEKFGIYAHGRIEYEDIFGNPHWMTYCSYIPTPLIGGFAFCAEHNETDDYQETKK